jgi:hypothetical protein
VTVAPERPPRRGGRRGFDFGKPSLLEFLNEISTICGMCFGHRELWCPLCGGLDGCETCNERLKVPCPECAGGNWSYWL